MSSDTTAPDAPPVSPDLPPPATESAESAESPPEIRDRQVRLKTDEGKLLLIFPPEAVGNSSANPLPLSWPELWQQFKQRLNGGERFWQVNTPVNLISYDRLLDSRQLQDIAEALAEVQLQLQRIYTSRRQTAVAAATSGYSVEQQSIMEMGRFSNPVPRKLAAASELTNSNQSTTPLEEPLYLQTTIRSGAEVRHPGTVVIVGDVNPGSSVIADGDILIWGNLRGVVHAGANGNSRCLIMALRMEPTQIRIADFVARAPAKPPAEYYPEVAHVTPEGIRITRVLEFTKR